jgi:hypothetical protein
MAAKIYGAENDEVFKSVNKQEIIPAGEKSVKKSCNLKRCRFPAASAAHHDKMYIQVVWHSFCYT